MESPLQKAIKHAKATRTNFEEAGSQIMRVPKRWTKVYPFNGRPIREAARDASACEALARANVDKSLNAKLYNDFGDAQYNYDRAGEEVLLRCSEGKYLSPLIVRPAIACFSACSRCACAERQSSNGCVDGHINGSSLAQMVQSKEVVMVQCEPAVGFYELALVNDCHIRCIAAEMVPRFVNRDRAKLLSNGGAVHVERPWNWSSLASMKREQPGGPNTPLPEYGRVRPCEHDARFAGRLVLRCSESCGPEHAPHAIRRDTLPVLEGNADDPLPPVPRSEGRKRKLVKRSSCSWEAGAVPANGSESDDSDIFVKGNV